MAFIERDPKDRLKIQDSSIATVDEILQKAVHSNLSVLPFDIEGYLKSINDITLDFEVMDKELSGYIEKRVDSYFIGINKYHVPNRQRFTMAHEYAHYIFDKDLLNSCTKHYEKDFFEEFYSRDSISLLRANRKSDDLSNKTREQRANVFASFLLMPKIFLDKKRTEISDIEALAEIFRVSPAAMYMRLKMEF